MQLQPVAHTPTNAPAEVTVDPGVWQLIVVPAGSADRNFSVIIEVVTP